MPTFAQGHGSRILMGRYDMSPFLSEWAIDATLDAPDITMLGSSHRTYQPGGLGDVTASFAGIYSHGTTADSTGSNSTHMSQVLDNYFGGSTRFVTTILPSGQTAGARALLLDAEVTSHAITSPVEDVLRTSVELQGSDGYDGGRLLRALAASTSTGSGAAVLGTGTTGTGGTTGGGVAHLHITAETNVTTATIKVQHSTSGSTWADLTTFTAATGPTWQRSTASGTIKEQLRATLSTLTEGATGGSLTWAVAFARRGEIKT